MCVVDSLSCYYFQTWNSDFALATGSVAPGLSTLGVAELLSCLLHYSWNHCFAAKFVAMLVAAATTAAFKQMQCLILRVYWLILDVALP